MNPETLVTVICGLAILVGVAGTIIPVLPGSILIGASLLAWALWGGAGTTGWVVFGIGLVFVLAGMAASAVLTGRKLKEHSIPSRSGSVLAKMAECTAFVVLPGIRPATLPRRGTPPSAASVPGARPAMSPVTTEPTLPARPRTGVRTTALRNGVRSRVSVYGLRWSSEMRGADSPGPALMPPS